MNIKKTISSNAKIFLTGFMGCGKTFLGKQIASKLNLSFYDLDSEIEKSTGLFIENIFQKFEEKYFRDLETGILLNWTKPGIIATGGGIAENNLNRHFLKNQKTIWLNPSFQEIFQRISNSKRPLVQKLSKKELFELWQKRLPFYKECCNLIYSGSSAEELIELISHKTPESG